MLQLLPYLYNIMKIFLIQKKYTRYKLYHRLQLGGLAFVLEHSHVSKACRHLQKTKKSNIQGEFISFFQKTNIFFSLAIKIFKKYKPQDTNQFDRMKKDHKVCSSVGRSVPEPGSCPDSSAELWCSSERIVGKVIGDFRYQPVLYPVAH